MTGCCANNCCNKHETGHVMLSFPKDPVTRAAWVSGCQMGEDWKPKPGNRLCEAHFERSQWLKYRNRLKRGAVPTIFCKCKGIKSNENVSNAKKPRREPIGKSELLAEKSETSRTDLLVLHDHLYSGTTVTSNSNKKRAPNTAQPHIVGCPLQRVPPVLSKEVAQNILKISPTPVAVANSQPNTINPKLISALSTAVFCKCGDTNSSNNISEANILKAASPLTRSTVSEQLVSTSNEHNQTYNQKKKVHSVGCPLRRGCIVQIVPKPYIPNTVPIPSSASNYQCIVPDQELSHLRAENLRLKEMVHSLHRAVDDMKKGSEGENDHKMKWIGFLSRADYEH